VLKRRLMLIQVQGRFPTSVQSYYPTHLYFWSLLWNRLRFSFSHLLRFPVNSKYPGLFSLSSNYLFSISIFVSNSISSSYLKVFFNLYHRKLVRKSRYPSHSWWRSSLSEVIWPIRDYGVKKCVLLVAENLLASSYLSPPVFEFVGHSKLHSCEIFLPLNLGLARWAYAIIS
jgi:hypothetical protein